MPTLVITDIPRISALLERLAAKRGNLAVVSEIHRGIEELDRLKPNLIVIQNHLSGLSADIVQKHLKSRLGRRKVRFALISPSDSLDIVSSTRFEAIIDPTQDDAALEASIQALFAAPERPARKQAPVSSILELPSLTEREPELPGLHAEAAPSEPPELETDEAHAPLKPAATALQPAAVLPPVAELLRDDDAESTTPATYDRPRRPNQSIVSAFSQHLDNRADQLPTAKVTPNEREEELAIRDLHLEPHLITDYDAAPPVYRRTGFWVLCGTIALVVAITLFQHRDNTRKPVVVSDKPAPPAQTQRSAPALATVPAAPLAQPAPPATPAAPAPSGVLQSHGEGRPKKLPSFIPQAGLDQASSKENPGWEIYRGQAYEYRVFRERDTTVKAIQVIDRSGVGIQDSFYVAILKELAGVTAMRPSASEIKEGYEIRRGEANGLQLVQYRDAQGGRLRGIVITWP